MGAYHVEWNPFNWNSEMFSAQNISDYWCEKADELYCCML